MAALDKQLFQFVLRSQTFTARQLADALHISEKTARERLKTLDWELKKNGAHILSRSGKGYQFRIVDPERFAIWREDVLRQTQAIPSTAQERFDYILRRILYADDFVKLDDLTNEMYISRTTMTADMKQVRQYLQLHNLMLMQRPGHGVCVAGAEFDIRNCKVNERLRQGLLNDDPRKASPACQQIVDVLVSSLRVCELSLAKSAFYSLLTYISVAAARIREGRMLNFSPEFQMTIFQQSNPKSIAVANKIGRELFSPDGCVSTEDEITGLILQIQSRDIFTLDKQAADDQGKDGRLENLARDMLTKVLEIHGLDLTEDEELLASLVQQLIPFELRMKYDIPATNPLLEQIKQDYALAYYIASSACLALEPICAKVVPDAEIGYFAVIFELALQKSESASRKNILVVCVSGQATAKLFMYRYQRAFAPFVEHIYTCSAFQINTFDFEGLKIDYVFTTVPLHLTLPVPVFQVSQLPSDQEIDRCCRILRGEGERFCQEFFKSQMFCGEIDAASKEDALAQMCQIVERSRPLPAGFLESVLAREKMGQTDFGNLVAIPHPDRIFNAEKFVSVAVLKRPVWWGHNDVQVVLLISLEQNDPDATRFYQTVSRLIGSPAAVQRLIKDPSFSTLLKVLKTQND